MSRLSLSANELRITARNGVQFHTWPGKDHLDEARKVATAWKDDELLADIDKQSSGDLVAVQAPAAVIDLDTADPDEITGAVSSDAPPMHVVKRRGRKPKTA